ncbi:cation:proton antiporter [Enterococcus sp. JM9B]|uniref:cation:proton antiporter n=1 Tax=Enterococcus sp. JM9B TaxID=1857216 RepID=UPI001374D4AF|nr:sodium:proton antiporter [Enterococcus sp. JM9B]KAF1304800.1 sodium:proton antiporter [Enterococcus sp. JM9B]
MAFIELVILIAGAITFSNIFNKIVPAIPIFFLQIFLGILLGLTSYGQSINFEPEIFLVMIIAPLLFREGEHADIPMILKNFGVVLALAFGGVLLTLLGVGLLLHQLLPFIPLAACFAFGAALGPTDAVAVGSLTKRLKISEKAVRILEGEGLLNDASGVTAFQFAVAALVSGTFSWSSAGFQLFMASVGGGLMGFLVVWVKRKIIQLIEQASAQDVTAYLLIELLLPFSAYLVAESFHVSGIIAAVVAGVAQAHGRRNPVTLFTAELANVSEATWSMIGFTLNGLVFIFLGIEVSQVFSPIWENTDYSNWYLLGIILLIALSLFLIRWVFITAIYLIKEGWHKMKESFSEILLLTFGGVKGTVSLATIFILPVVIHEETFENRALLLFLTAGVILVTLVVALMVLPLLSDGEAELPLDRNQVLILKEVTKQLRKDREIETLSESENVALQSVIDAYEGRIWETYEEALTESEQQEVQEIQGLILSIERTGLDENFRKGKISRDSYRIYSRFITNFQKSATRQFFSFLGFWFLVVWRIIRVITHPRLFLQRRHSGKKELKKRDISELQRVFEENTQEIQRSLEHLRDIYDEQLIEGFLHRRQSIIERLQRSDFFFKMMLEGDPAFTKEILRGYYLERKVIDEFEEAEKITTFSANDYRKQVNLLESYAINQTDFTSLTNFLWQIRIEK